MVMKVLLGTHLFFPYDRAGTEVLTLEMARGLRTRGHSVQIVTGKAEKNASGKKNLWLTQDLYDGFTVHRLHYGAASYSDPITLHISASDRVRLVRELVSHLTPDIVHFNHIKVFSGMVIPEIKAMGIPVFFTPTDFWTVCPKATLFRTYDKEVCEGPGDAVNCVRCYQPMPTWASRLALKIGKTPLRKLSGRINSLNALGRRVDVMIDCVNAADRVLPATRFLADVLIRHGIDENRIKVVPYGVEVGYLPEKVSIPAYFTDASPLRLGFIGTLSEVKGPHIILDALSFLADNNRKVVLDIYGKVGQGNPYCRMLQEKAKEFGTAVQFRGMFPHEKIGEIMRRLHLVIVPSLWYESTPLVLCSALAAGIPVLVSRLGGMTEVVNEGINGFSFPAGDARALSTIISKILDNPKMLETIQRNSEGRKRSMSDYVGEIESEYFAVMTNGSLEEVERID